MVAMADMEQRCADLAAQSNQQYIKMLLAQEKALRKQGIADEQRDVRFRLEKIHKVRCAYYSWDAWSRDECVALNMLCFML